MQAVRQPQIFIFVMIACFGLMPLVLCSAAYVLSALSSFSPHILQGYHRRCTFR
eukprot:m.218131 g.218131  ORF g.218131 m.218131 type:complete len:54 (+) comp54114_c0_seq5:325-486(+)